MEYSIIIGHDRCWGGWFLWVQDDYGRRKPWAGPFSTEEQALELAHQMLDNNTLWP